MFVGDSGLAPFVDGGVDLPCLAGVYAARARVAVLDVSALARATEHVLPWAYARFLQARVHSARRPNRYGDRANARTSSAPWGITDTQFGSHNMGYVNPCVRGNQAPA